MMMKLLSQMESRHDKEEQHASWFMHWEFELGSSVTLWFVCLTFSTRVCKSQREARSEA